MKVFLEPLVPLFWISDDVSSRFQNQSGFCLIHFFGGRCNVHSLRSTLWCYTCQPLGGQHHSWLLPRMHQQRWEVAWIQMGQSPTEKMNVLSSCQQHSVMYCDDPHVLMTPPTLKLCGQGTPTTLVPSDLSQS